MKPADDLRDDACIGGSISPPEAIQQQGEPSGLNPLPLPLLSIIGSPDAPAATYRHWQQQTGPLCRSRQQEAESDAAPAVLRPTPTDVAASAR